MSTASSAAAQQPTGGKTIELTSLTPPQLTALKKQLDDELEHLTTSFSKLRAAQVKFKECLKSIENGVEAASDDKPVLVPLTTSLYVPGQIADREKVIVDVGTGYYVEKTTKDAKSFYTAKVEDLGTNLKDLESIVQGKSNSLRAVEEVLRQKVMAVTSSAEVGGGS